MNSIIGLSRSSVPAASLSHSLRHHQHGAGAGGGLSRPTPQDDLDLPSDSPLTPDELYRLSTAGTPTTVTPSPEPPTPPRIVELPVRQHREVHLNCELVASSNASLKLRASTLMWFHDGRPVDAFILDKNTRGSGLGHRYMRDLLTGQLRIANARLEDEGVWHCEDRDPITGIVISTGKPTRLIVLEPPRSLYLAVDGRRLDPGNLFLPVKEGAELAVSCVVEGGHPPATLAWLLTPHHTPGLNTSGGMHPHISEAHLGTVLRAHHNATVTCLARHQALAHPLNQSLQLHVQYSPSFAISRVPGFGFPLREGIPVSLKCDVDSNPPASPVWVKDDGAPPVAQSGDGFLNFSAIRREHSGWYKCTSRHLLGEYSSIGYFLNVRYEEGPEVTQDPGPDGDSTSDGRQVEVALGGAVQLQCPAATVGGCWSRVGTGGRLQPVGPGPDLTLDRVLYQEAGEYRCVVERDPAELDQWRADLDVQLIVTGRPAVYPANKTLTAMMGQSLSLTVEFCANPPASRTVWLTDSRVLRPGEVTDTLVAHNITAGSSEYCHQAVLTLITVTESDQGEYVFLVRSQRGLAEGTVTLNVTRASSFSVAAARAHHITAAVAATALYTISAWVVASNLS
ncbi:CD166 antigen [Periplaneta americana]|uniref:CD166 antigen n=1 Tax=Periplaneta americana TaxID=6978 RepID=UPI0037E8E6B1